jgi:hypothetical protein
MAELEFSRDDIVSLIEKISTLQPDFSDQELQLLMSIFALAAEHVMPAGELQTAMLPEAVAPGQQAGGGPATVDELQQQLLQAYIPGSSFDSVTGSDAEVAVWYSIGRFAGTHSIGRFSGTHSIGRTAGTEPSSAAAEGQPGPEEG